MIFGKHSLDETRDLLEVANYRFKETGKAFDALSNKPSDLAHDWEVLSDRWAKDRKEIANALIIKGISSIPLPASATATEPEYRRILDYVQFQENVHGSLQDITRRIEQLSGKSILYENQPRQDATDVDIDLFKKLDATTRDMDAAADAAKQGAKQAATSDFGLMVGGACIAGLVVLGLTKKYL